MASAEPETQEHEVKEGKAYIRGTGGNKVFYNNVQEFNRDLSIVMIKTFIQERNTEYAATVEKQQRSAARFVERESAKLSSYEDKKRAEMAAKIEQAKTTDFTQPPKIKILEALSATGLRSIRYFKEIEGIQSVLANDVDPAAVQAIRANVVRNGLSAERDVIPNLGDANDVMYKHRVHHQFDVVDLDPYGSAAEFLDAAVQSVSEGGLLCVTCTDSSVLCGNHSEVSWAKYGGVALHTYYGHEMGVRILLQTIDKHANAYRRYIEPMLAMSIDFYVRVWVRVYTSAAHVKHSASKQSLVWHCNGCEVFYLQPMQRVTNPTAPHPKFAPNVLVLPGSACPDCGAQYKLGGPMWGVAMHSVAWVKRALALVQAQPELYGTHRRIIGQLTVVSQELATPLAYMFSAMCRLLKVSTPKSHLLRSALVHAGYAVSQAHWSREAVKTTAPPSVIWDILRAWVAEHPPKKGPTQKSGLAILAKPPTLKANFTMTKEAHFDESVSKFLPNPEENWGPKARAGSAKGATKKRKGGSEAKEAEEEEDQRDGAGAGAEEEEEEEGEHHSDGDGEPAVPSHVERKQRSRKTKACFLFQQGKCTLGDDCNFLHELRLEPHAKGNAKERRKNRKKAKANPATAGDGSTMSLPPLPSTPTARAGSDVDMK